MDTPMRVSLIIPAYNEEKYIGACLDAAIQSGAGRFFEIIVIDNGSTDATAIEVQKHAGVRVVREEKKGLTKARERGFLESRGDILAFIDADTRMPVGWYEKIVQEFSHHENLAVLSGPYRYFDIPFLQSIGVTLYWYLLGLPMYWLVGYMTVGGNFAIKKSVLEKMGGFDTSIEFYGEDTDIARRASKFGKAKFMLRFFIYTSGRRFKGQGLFKTSLLYMANFASEVFLHRPVTGTYKDIR